MVDQQIIDYIKTNVSGGYPLEDIKKKILDSGVSQTDLDEAVKEAGVEGGVSQPSEEAAKEEKPTEEAKAGEPAQQTAAQPPAEKQESTFKWWVIVIPLLVLILMWAIFYFMLRG